MKKNLILLCSLFMATALISSCAQDAMEPEVDAQLRVLKHGLTVTRPRKL